ncbi:MAG: radical SAM protein [Nitrospiraceae bacterium]|nr:radical SAM protein [Nitrospiraceae bacterium]
MRSETIAHQTTTKRVLTRRGVMWLGQTCNLRCYFCYFASRIADSKHPEHAFMALEKAKQICHTLRHTYGNTAIDIQGGEPTIYPQILELVSYCRDIGLYPTLITNGLALIKPGVVEGYRDAGVRDFLVSLHGIGDIHDQVVGVRGAYDKIIAAIGRMRETGVPLRFNCTMSKPVIPVLPEIARKAIEYGAYGVNYIAFNPFGDQESGTRTHENVAKYSEIKPILAEAIDMLEEAGIETNVRYLPLCMAEPRHRKNFYNYQQLSYDTHEWDYQSWLWTMMAPQMMKPSGLVPSFRLGVGARKVYSCNGVAVVDMFQRNPVKLGLKFIAQRNLARLQQLFRGKEALYREEARVRASKDCNYRYHDACQRCAAQDICDGFHGDYADFFGTDEAVPITDIQPTHDPKFFIREQEKAVELEDESWAT